MSDAATILICDDEPSLRELMRISLGSDYAFVEAGTATEAIELLDRVAPDLVLLDVMMPGASGLAVLEHIRGSDASSGTPVVIVSAFDTDRDRLAAYDLGATEFIGKPFDPEELEAVVEDLLATSR
jgi:DNA-binding response OmpR family regulator